MWDWTCCHQSGLRYCSLSTGWASSRKKVFSRKKTWVSNFASDIIRVISPTQLTTYRASCIPAHSVSDSLITSTNGNGLSKINLDLLENTLSENASSILGLDEDVNKPLRFERLPWQKLGLVQWPVIAEDLQLSSPPSNWFLFSITIHEAQLLPRTYFIFWKFIRPLRKFLVWNDVLK